MMLPAAVTMLPVFLIFRWLGWVDTLRPLWAPAFLGSAFHIFLLRQFFLTIPMELEEAGTELEFVIMVIAVSCVKLLSAHNSTQHTSRKHKV
jgi:carbohydrate ABC transporter membrane protein 2, CUT1 family (TC 3.A.1.1.-)